MERVHNADCSKSVVILSAASPSFVIDGPPAKEWTTRSRKTSSIQAICRYPFEQSSSENAPCRRPASLPSSGGPQLLQGGHLFDDRRQYPRLVPASLLLVQVSEYGGLLSNISEGGLAVNRRFPDIQGEAFCVAVELPDSSSPLRATAQTAWTSNSENRTGLRFVDLPAASRQQLRQWLSAHAAAEVREWAPSFHAARVAQCALAAGPRQRAAGRPAGRGEAWHEAGLRRWTGLVLTSAALGSACIFLGYYLGSRSQYQRNQAIAPAATMADVPAKGQVEPAKLPPVTSPAPSTVSLDTPGFVLQVGAMTNESNADALSDSLQRIDFPAFVFKRTHDRFYKVAVGAFADVDSATVAKRKLEKQGFQAILRQWSPE